jgi:hypothetical protein
MAAAAVTPKPEHVFDRDAEWAGLTRFVANAHRGALLGVVIWVVSGRYRGCRVAPGRLGFGSLDRSAKDTEIASGQTFRRRTQGRSAEVDLENA